MYNLIIMNDGKILETGKKTLDVEIQALKEIKSRMDARFVNAVKIIQNCKGRVIVTGMGKSGIIARKIAASFASVGIPSYFLHAAEAGHGDMGVILKNDAVVAVSNSGETDEILRILPPLKKMGVKIISLAGNAASTLARQSDVCLHVGVKKEADPLNLIPTSSTTATLAMGDALLVTLMAIKKVRREDFGVLHPGGSAGRLFLKVKDLMHKGRQLPVISEDAVFKEALIIITEKKLGAVFVMNAKKKLTGIVTDGDVRRIIQKFSRDPEKLLSTKVSHIMSRNPKSLTEGSYCVEAVKIMEAHSITVIPVCSADGKPSGALHLHDLVKAGFAIESARGTEQ